jgi:hypothetical protein
MEINKQNIDDFILSKEILSDSEITYYKAISLIAFHVFIIEIQDEHALRRVWKKLYNKIAFYMQNKFDNNFEKWNLYLFYVISEKCSIPLKYEIENNPFSSRKVVVENNDGKNVSHESIISRQIFDSEIKLDNTTEKVKPTELELEGEIFDLIKNPKLRLSSDGRNKDKTIEATYEKLLKTYNNEI